MSCSRTQGSDAGVSSCKQFRSRSDRQKVFPLKSKLSRSSGSNDGKNGKVLNMTGIILCSSTKPSSGELLVSPNKNENH